ncbi:MAG: hypothetical protein EOP88_21675, partial [Verrucomicrobiaceae bacterium]
MFFQAASVSLLLSGMLAAEVRPEPYEPDPFTLQLWHLDEGGPPFRNAVMNGDSLRGMHNGARAGESGMPGMGHAVSFHHDAGGGAGSPSFAG